MIFKQLEPNLLKGLQAGFVVGQLPMNESSALLVKDGNKKFLENGHIMTIKATDASADGTAEKLECDIWEDGLPMYISFAEELNTVIDEKNQYALNVANEYPRLIQLMPGDEWMTDIDYLNDEKYASIKSALIKHIKQVNVPTDDWFAVNTMADGTKGFHYIYLG